jgi:hypothetical protein
LVAVVVQVVPLYQMQEVVAQEEAVHTIMLQALELSDKETMERLVQVRLVVGVQVKLVEQMV